MTIICSISELKYCDFVVFVAFAIIYILVSASQTELLKRKNQYRIVSYLNLIILIYL